jgi:hypothetical protein
MHRDPVFDAVARKEQEEHSCKVCVYFVNFNGTHGCALKSGVYGNLNCRHFHRKKEDRHGAKKRKGL